MCFCPAAVNREHSAAARQGSPGVFVVGTPIHAPPNIPAGRIAPFNVLERERGGAGGGGLRTPIRMRCLRGYPIVSRDLPSSLEIWSCLTGSVRSRLLDSNRSIPTCTPAAHTTGGGRVHILLTTRAL